MIVAAALFFVKRHGDSFDGDMSRLSNTLKTHLSKMYFTSNKFSRDVIDRIAIFVRTQGNVPNLIKNAGSSVKSSFLLTVAALKKKILGQEKSTAVAVYMPNQVDKFMTETLTANVRGWRSEWDRFKVNLVRTYRDARNYRNFLIEHPGSVSSEPKTKLLQDNLIKDKFPTLKEYIDGQKGGFFYFKSGKDLLANRIAELTAVLHTNKYIQEDTVQNIAFAIEDLEKAVAEDFEPSRNIFLQSTDDPKHLLRSAERHVKLSRLWWY